VNRKRTASTGLILLLAIVTATSLVIAGCGDDGSSEEDAQTKVCEAVNDLQGQVQQLQSYTLATVTADKVNGNIDAIESDVSEIKSTLPDLSSDLKSQLESATDAFTSELSSVAQSPVGPHWRVQRPKSPPPQTNSPTPTGTHLPA
jgi:outer membrane murein-binding lipoprotein Lpp